jgi:hypothetical protein
MWLYKQFLRQGWKFLESLVIIHNTGIGGVVQWKSACLACLRPLVYLILSKEGEKNKKLKKTQ